MSQFFGLWYYNSANNYLTHTVLGVSYNVNLLNSIRACYQAVHDVQIHPLMPLLDLAWFVKAVDFLINPLVNYP